MRRLRNVKIVATLGPASSDRAMIRALVEAGADVFRLNMSHGSQDEIAARHRIIREIEHQTGRPIGILADLQGPKLRVSRFKDGKAELQDDQKYRIELGKELGDAERAFLPHPEIFKAIKPGSRLLINDGQIRLRVESCDETSADTIVEVGGTISDRKGVNVPDVVLPIPALTAKDKDDLEFVCNLGVDWLAMSFVQRADDVAEGQRLAAGRAAVLAKIEKPAAVDDIDSILAEADGIMVARGDLGVEMPVHKVPVIQRRLITTAQHAGKPVIVATQMLESMINAPVPTRAEVSDVATAIYDGADAVMLSAESAAGDYPVEAVATMNAVAEEVERDPHFRERMEALRPKARARVADAIAAAAREVAETTDIKAICCFTHGGTTAQLVARERPRVPILALTPSTKSARRMALVWGMHCILTHEVERFKLAVVSAARAARENGFATEQDRIVVVAGIPFNTAGTTNILRVAPVDERLIYEGEPE
ncbi:pyruvate kinase [Albimonas sp. CAU 1670]|uniref:pyruvate kinase n=1 Tax=Albimonas sp. CAU 1670 TaxID=3032599 RepID=UPI0023DBA9B7|nr:pyruvate kinase [Albimonas sp. CAU 1670]MDF2235192.1 pyruvate kinase [Albimonas sp. CAU 1670]